MKKRRTRKATIGKAMSVLNRKLHDARVLAVIICVLFAILVAILLGNLLGKAAEDALPDDTTFPTDETTSDTNEPEEEIIRKAPDICAEYADIDSIDESQQSGIDFSGADVSLFLRMSDGTLAYHSAVAASFGFDTDGSHDLNALVSYAHSGGKRLSACFCLCDYSEYSKEEQMVYSAYEAALISELDSAGVDDILLFGLDISSSRLEDSIAFLDLVKSAAKNAKIGVAAEYVESKSESYSYRLSRIYSIADYVAIDYSEFALDVEGFATALRRTSYYHKRFFARALFTKISDAAYDSEIALLRDGGIFNHQVICVTAAG